MMQNCQDKPQNLHIGILVDSFRLCIRCAQLMDNISILMYWEAEEGADKTDTELIVQVSCEKGKQKSVITTTYVLNVAEKLYEDAPAEDEDPFNSAVNPKRNTIKPGEIWSWGEGTME